MNQGFILLHRQLLDWEWYDHIPTKVLFIHCLLRANHTAGRWRGQAYKRGEFITSLNTLVIETGLTPKQVRTAIDNLVESGELGKVATSLNTLISVTNYEFYQGQGTPKDKPKAHEGQSKGTRGAREGQQINNVNKYNNVTNWIDIEETFSFVVDLFDETNQPKTEKQINAWKDTIRLLNEVDGLEFDTIKHLVQVTRNDDFWSRNFLTLLKLRKKDKNGTPYWNVFFNKFKLSKNEQFNNEITSDAMRIRLERSGLI